MKYNIGILILCCFYLFSCDQGNDSNKGHRKQFYNDEGLLVKRTFYEEDDSITILTEKIFKDDTIPHGYARSYYKSGQLMGEEYYRNGIKSGISQQFYSNGQQKYKGWLKDGKLDSLGVAYYENGQLKAKLYFKKGEKIGEQLYYHPNGNLSKYLLYDPVGELVYCRQYKEDGEFLDEEGARNTQIVYGYGAMFTVDETLSVKIYAPTPPDCEVNLFVSIKNASGETLINKKPVPIKNGLATYQTEVSEIGKYYFETTINFKDLATGEQEEYTNAFEYVVVPESDNS